MKTPRILQFFIQDSEDGGYTAEAVGYAVFTQGETLDEVVANIQEAVECHFGGDKKIDPAIPITVNFALPATV